jgi:hypothetical protein
LIWSIVIEPVTEQDMSASDTMLSNKHTGLYRVKDGDTVFCQEFLSHSHACSFICWYYDTQYQKTEHSIAELSENVDSQGDHYYSKWFDVCVSSDCRLSELGRTYLINYLKLINKQEERIGRIKKIYTTTPSGQDTGSPHASSVPIYIKTTTNRDRQPSWH